METRILIYNKTNKYLTRIIMKTKHFLLLALAFIIAIPNYAQKPKKTKIGDIVINCCVNKETGEMYGSGTLKIVPILSGHQ